MADCRGGAAGDGDDLLSKGKGSEQWESNASRGRL